jgi:medium-chain acyl-[acyl-carrier-protein] hydrolase
MTTSKSQASPWLVCSTPNPNARIRLFCLPYAGGGALIYRKWAEGLPATIEVQAIEPPGRGRRQHEKPFDRLTPLVAEIASVIRPYLDRPFAFFGHSIGAMISFELARYLRRTEGLEAAHLFVAGRRAPQIPGTRKDTHNLPEPEFIEELRRLSGTPEEVLTNPELMRLMIPLLRADFSLAETYVYEDEPPLPVPITAFSGLDDTEVSREELEAWRVHTNGTFSLRMLAGDHFFLHSARAFLLRAISQDLLQAIRRQR